MRDLIIIPDTPRDWATFAIDQGWMVLAQDGSLRPIPGVAVAHVAGKVYVRLHRDVEAQDRAEDGASKLVRAFQRVGTEDTVEVKRERVQVDEKTLQETREVLAQGDVKTWRSGGVRLQDDPADPGPDLENPRAEYRPDLVEHQWL